MVYLHDTSIIEQIEKAAEALIFSYGIKGWNMDDCAQKAGITKRTLYQYIPSKENLIEYVLLKYIRTTQKKLSQELSSSLDFISGLEKIISVFPSLIVRMDSRIMQSIFLTYPAVEQKVMDAKKELLRETISFIEQGRKEGFIKKDIEADTILGILQALVIYHIKNNPLDISEKLEKSFHAVVYGFLQTKDMK